MKARQKRLVFVGLAIVGVGFAASLALNALRSNIAYFFSPSQVQANEHPMDAVFRVGGLVVDGSLARESDGLTVRFDVTDNAATVPVVYHKALPDLFGEGQGVVAKGRMGADGVFVADEVLAKHDESYVPPEVADALQTAHVDGMIEAVQNDTMPGVISTTGPGAGGDSE